jgi:hypothetical protein
VILNNYSIPFGGLPCKGDNVYISRNDLKRITGQPCDTKADAKDYIVGFINSSGPENKEKLFNLVIYIQNVLQGKSGGGNIQVPKDTLSLYASSALQKLMKFAADESKKQ